ncbi:hypothetical protein ACFVIM_29705 [Streptomyces sp. NPDC057638]|uniref:hypothetical protein n=1 Tax=Streptomyces sp. NPDC057638 TaxID=3346190 RepID=UPI00368A0E6F
MGAGTALRLTHTAVLAAVCVVLSGLGHDLSSGVSPSPWGYALALPPVCAAAWWLTRAERSAPVVVGAIALGQPLLHVLFGAAPHGPGGGASGRTHNAGHRPGHTPLTDGPPPEPLSPHALFDPSLLTFGMAGAHLLAGAVCGWWLWRGERALVQLGRALTLFTSGIRAVLRLIREVLGGEPPRLPSVAVALDHRVPVRRPDSFLLLRGLSRRGPPLLPS